MSKLGSAQILTIHRFKTTSPLLQQNVTVKVVDLKSPDTTKVLRAENVSSSRLVYLTGVSWAGDDHIMTVWLDHYHKVLTYLLCDVNTAVCKLVNTVIYFLFF